MFEDAGRETFRQMSFVERLNIESVTAQDFLPSEKDSQTVKLIQSCVDQGVPVEWIVFERKIKDSPRLQQHCNMANRTRPLDQLLVLGVHGCPLQWISPVHRALFYQHCLHKFNITAYKRKARSASRRLQNLAFEQKRLAQASAERRTGGGVAMVVGGILSGLGVVLAPLTAGGSLTAFGSGIALAGSAVATFGHQAVQDGEGELVKLREDSQQLSMLLLLYTQSARSVSDYQENLRMQEIAKGIIAEVEKNCFQKIPRTTANEANVEKLSNAWLPNIVAERAKAQVDQVQVQEQERTENNAASFEPKISWSSVLTVSRMPDLLKRPFKPILKNFLKLLKKQNRSMKRTLLSSAVQSGLGIYEVVKGVRKLRKGLDHHVITAARRILHETDSLVFAYSKIMGEDDVEENNLVKEVFAVDVHVTNSNWVPLSRTFLTLSNGKDACTTPMVTGWSLGWTRIFDLGDCKYFR